MPDHFGRNKACTTGHRTTAGISNSQHADMQARIAYTTTSSTLDHLHCWYGNGSDLFVLGPRFMCDIDPRYQGTTTDSPVRQLLSHSYNWSWS
jgi:hypothetical protein